MTVGGFGPDLGQGVITLLKPRLVVSGYDRTATDR